MQMNNKYKLLPKSQSLTLEFNSSFNKILAKTSLILELKIFEEETEKSNDNFLNFKNNFIESNIELNLQQISIEKIVVLNENVELINFSCYSLNEQANFIENNLKNPLSFDYFFEFLKKNSHDFDKLKIFFKINEKIFTEKTKSSLLFYFII